MHCACVAFGWNAKKAFHGTAAKNPLFCIMHLVLSSVISVTPFGNNTQESLYVKFQQKDTVNVKCMAPPAQEQVDMDWQTCFIKTVMR